MANVTINFNLSQDVIFIRWSRRSQQFAGELDLSLFGQSGVPLPRVFRVIRLLAELTES